MNTIGNTNSIRYIRKIDYREPTADYKIANQVENGSKVLEIGTSSGYMSEFLTVEKNCEVTGVEYNKELFEKAKKFFKKGYNKDLNKISEWENEIEDNYFEYIICQDVLEHLLNPFEVLENLSKKLKKNGKILVSIPNVSHNAIIMEILKDKFSYEQSGSLDYTHFKFYTARSFMEESNKINLVVISHDITYLVPEDSSLNNSYSDYSIKEREVLFDHYNGHVFQNIFTLGKKEDYPKAKQNLMQFKLQNYDEITINNGEISKKYYYHDGETLNYIVDKDISKIKIYPSIRLKKYNLDIMINNEKYKLSTYEFPTGISNEHEKRYISTGTEAITINRNFKINDVISIKIYNSESIFDEIINGQSYYDSEIVSLKSKISNYKSISISAMDTLFLKNVLKLEELDKIIKQSNETKLQVLKKFLILNPFFKEIIDFARVKNMDMYIVNDNYIDEKDLKSLLKFNNLEDIKLLNYSEIYKLVEDNNLHIGNDIAKDILNIKSLGMDTYLYKEPIKRIKKASLTKSNNISESIVRAIQINHIYCGLPFTYFEKFGMQELSLIYYYFTNWLYKKTRDKDNLFFLSRDGYMPYKVYQKILKKNGEKKNIKYIYASRKAYQIPGLATVDINKTVKTLTEFNLQLNEKLLLRDVLTNATLNAYEINENILNKYGFNSIEDEINSYNVNKTRELLKVYIEKIKLNLEEKLKLAREYLIQEGLNNYKDINLVDIGWRGSVQNYIQKILDINTHGYYVGTTPTEYKDISKNMEGCYCNKYLPFFRSEFLLDNIMMLELVFTAPAPQLIGFRKKGKKVEPVFSEVNANSIHEVVNEFQSSSLRIIDEYLKYSEYLDGLSPDFTLLLFKEYVEEKKYEDILEMKRLETNIGYGEKQRKYVETVKLEELLKDNKKVLKKANFAFWKGAMYIDGVDSVKEYNEILNKYNFKTKLGKIESTRYYRSLEIIIDKKKNK